MRKKPRYIQKVIEKRRKRIKYIRNSGIRIDEGEEERYLRAIRNNIPFYFKLIFNKNKLDFISVQLSRNRKIIGRVDIKLLDYINKKAILDCVISEGYKEFCSFVYENLFSLFKERNWKDIIINSSLVEKHNSSILCTGKSVKVISLYLGNRGWPPNTQESCFKMLQFLYEMEISLDQGCPMDTIIVHNNPLLENSYNSGVSDIISYQKCIDFLKTINGKNTKNGIIRIEERPNIGMSFGSFSYIFDKYKKDYDYWMFVEDDHILINNNVLSQGIKQLTSIEDIDRICGFVAIVGLTVKRKETGTFAYGGMGISGREILEQVCKTNNGILPFLDTFELQDDRRCHNRYGEKPFSQYIRDRLKYLLKNIGMKDVVMVWGGVPHWKESMRHTQNKRLLSIDKYQKYKTLYNF